MPVTDLTFTALAKVKILVESISAEIVSCVTFYLNETNPMVKWHPCIVFGMLQS
jgi:hypothetical protein